MGTHIIEPVRLVHIQLAIECIGLNKDGFLIRIPGPDPDDIARVYVFKHKDGFNIYFRQDVPAFVREQVQALTPDRAFDDREAVKTILMADSPCAEVGTWQTYTFPDTLKPSQFPSVVRLDESHRALMERYHAGVDVTKRAIFGIIRDGMIVSTCSSVRENEQAGECYVYTVEPCRGRGYGKQVTTAWAHHIRQQGKIAFYSHALDNPASQAVARGLGLWPCFIGVTYS
jgi:RimJ/RimL family protein N-acetyltransferase